MGCRVIYSIKTHFRVVNYDFVRDPTYRVVCFFCSFLFGLFSRRFFRKEESRPLSENDSNSHEFLQTQDDNRTCSSCSSDLETEKQSSRYEYLSGKDISRFLEEPTTLSCTVFEPNLGSDLSDPVFDMHKVGLDAVETEDSCQSNMADSDDSKVILEEEEEPNFIDEIISDDKDSRNHEFETEKTEDSVKSLVLDEVLEEINDLDNEDNPSDEVRLLSEHVSEEFSVCSSNVFLVDSTRNEVSSDGILDEEPKPENHVFEGKREDNREMETSDSDEEYIELHLNKPNPVLFEQEDEEETSSSGSGESFDEQFSEELCCFYEEEESDFEVQQETDNLVEHDDLIHQLKMELKLARTGGLPTILEESESPELETPKALKPMKIDDHKLDYKNVLEGVRKVYRNYSDKMRKFDVLNFQTMHALGLLEIKDAADFQRARKSSSVPAIMSLLSHNLWLCKGSAVIEPMRKVIGDMHRDYESVYIGQLCLSWEMLNWQYWKVQELQNHVSQNSHCFNQVAGEFQLFQVLVQRFLENEPFQGPRIQNYVNNRCVLRTLLQVPLLRDDSLKEKGKSGNKSKEDAITSQTLQAIIEQSMKVFWDFVRADKEESNALFHSNFEELVDLELLTDVRNDFQKKDKKVKDMLRSGNCIVKRFKKQREEDKGMQQTLLIAQVDLKLVAKVLNMSTLTTDKLIWCHEKLDKIQVCNRKVVVESSFSLFPC